MTLINYTGNRRAGGGFYTAACVIFAIGFAVCLLARPQICIPASREAVVLCAATLIPSLLPFLTVNGILLGSGAAEYAARTAGPLFSRIFGCSPVFCAPFFIGVTSGFPTGALSVVRAYENGFCTKNEAERALSFCSNAGAAFTVSALGTLLGDLRLGAAIYAAQIVSALVVSRVFCRRTAGAAFAINGFAPPRKRLFTGAVTGAVIPLLNVCAFVIVFAPVVALIRSTAQFLEAPPEATGLLVSAIELTNAAAYLSSAVPTARAAVLCAFAVGWSGFCVHAQIAAFASEKGLSMKYYFAGKLLNGALSAFLVWISTRFLFGY